ncbi:MAG: aminotransferase class I/II-fold pyridoxal phosphate-dependent enzyme [Bacilli bacterium]|nr:aminotransferase class I/II-fold pyridoxal phosphate-dependent enzyme [Bacilli bacterium]
MANAKFPSDLVLALNHQAEERAKKGIDVTNATVGMFFKDDGSLPIPSCFTSQDFTKNTKYTYSPTVGVPGYLKNVLPWFFKEEVASLPSDRFTMATPGGTGALFLSFYELNEQGYKILYPEISWPNYPNIVKATKAKADRYPNFDGNALNVKGIKGKMGKGKVALLINDPCQNPTGYSMSKQDWDKVVDLLNEDPSNRALILDLAYYDYAEEESKANIIDAIRNIDARIPCFVCFSFSKSFSIYGLRVGALTLFHGFEGANIRLKDLARAAWSSGNVLGMNLIKHALDIEGNKEELRNELADNRKMLSRRGDLFLKEAKEVGLESYPYHEGFFCSLKVNDAVKVAETLREKDIFIAPIGPNIIRVAFSCVPYSKIGGLAKAIKDADN